MHKVMQPFHKPCDVKMLSPTPPRKWALSVLEARNFPIIVYLLWSGIVSTPFIRGAQRVFPPFPVCISEHVSLLLTCMHVINREIAAQLACKSSRALALKFLLDSQRGAWAQSFISLRHFDDRQHHSTSNMIFLHSSSSYDEQRRVLPYAAKWYSCGCKTHTSQKATAESEAATEMLVRWLMVRIRAKIAHMADTREAFARISHNLYIRPNRQAYFAFFINIININLRHRAKVMDAKWMGLRLFIKYN